MKTLFAAMGAFVLTAAVNLAPASAARYDVPAASTGTPHYEWQYHYVGHHPEYRGGWVLVK
jgi:hypothetical protein